MVARAGSPALPSLEFETAMAARQRGPVAGVDEAGRGPWAGPVVAAAVILDPDNIPSGINDSKQLTAHARSALYEEIAAAARFGVGVAAVGVIDDINILKASLLAMRQAVEALSESPAGVLIDGPHCPALQCPATAIVRGDQRSLSIAAASIIAKVTRDRLMARLAEECPGYGWEHNMGYGTRKHALALARLGVTPHHRRSFEPVRARLLREA